MDDARFDVLTRRGFGLTAGGLASAIFGLAAVDDGIAKKKHRKKKCKKSEKRCGKKCIKGTCCPGKACGEFCECRRDIEGKAFCAVKGAPVACEQCESGIECLEGFQCGPSDRCAGLTTLCLLTCDEQSPF